MVIRMFCLNRSELQCERKLATLLFAKNRQNLKQNQGRTSCASWRRGRNSADNRQASASKQARMTKLRSAMLTISLGPSQPPPSIPSTGLDHSRPLTSAAILCLKNVGCPVWRPWHKLAAPSSPTTSSGLKLSACTSGATQWSLRAGAFHRVTQSHRFL